jgi:hypothetical protein
MPILDALSAAARAFVGHYRSAQPADFRAIAPAATTQPGTPLPGTKATGGDYLQAILPEQIDVRSRWGQVIKEVTSNGMHGRWIYVCDRCGTNNFVAVIHTDRKFKCMGGCGKEFSISDLRAEAIKRARQQANLTRGAGISLDRKFTDEELDNWYFTLPELCPTTQTSKVSQLQERLNKDDAELEWTGSKYTESLDSTTAFSDPFSVSRH